MGGLRHIEGKKVKRKVTLLVEGVGNDGFRSREGWWMEIVSEGGGANRESRYGHLRRSSSVCDLVEVWEEGRAVVWVTRVSRSEATHVVHQKHSLVWLMLGREAL